MLSTEKKLIFARALGTVGVIVAGSSVLLITDTDLAEEIGIRAWVAALIVRGMLWTALGAFLGWSGGYLLGHLLCDPSWGWEEALVAQTHRRRRRRRRRSTATEPHA